MNIHFVGSLGVSMKVLKDICEKNGITVSGSDALLSGHNGDNVIGKDLVVYTSAVGKNNVELLCAKALGIPVIERAQFLGLVSSQYQNVIAVSGSHGKTTTTGFLQEVFSSLNPTVHIGGSINGKNGRIGGREYFITEACEYRRSFLFLNPKTAIILNTELDHTDYYNDLDDYLSAFYSFAKNSQNLIVNGDDKNAREITSKNKFTFGLEDGNDFTAKNIEFTKYGSKYSVIKNGKEIAEIIINIKGRHNIYNSLAAFAAGYIEGIPAAEITQGLADFKGVDRRFEYLGKLYNSDIYTDYAHHPSEINSTVLSARESGKKKVTIIFQPHTYSRTKALEDEFVKSLSLADEIILVPIYAAREAPIEGVTSKALAKRLESIGKKTMYFETFLPLSEYLFNEKNDDEIIVFTGAGDIDNMARKFMEINK